ncbi:MAG: dockerin type I domain-containing protein [Pirellulaceae bacterium]
MALQTILEKVFESGVVGQALDTGAEYFNRLFDDIAVGLNSARDLRLVQLLLDGIEPPEVIDVDFLRDRLLGLNGTDGIFDFELGNLPTVKVDFDAGETVDAKLQRAIEVASELIQLLMTPSQSVIESSGLTGELQDDAYFDNLLGNAHNNIFDAEHGLANLLTNPQGVLTRVQELIDGVSPDVNEAPLIVSIYENYLATVRFAHAQAAFIKALRQTIVDASGPAADLFFERVNPSLVFNAGISPTLLGIPISDLGLDTPSALDRATESIGLTVNKRGISLRAENVGIIEKMLRIFGGALPIYDRFDVDVEIPTENLVRDVLTLQPWEIDTTRDWRGQFVGSVGVGSGLAGFDVGQFAALVFPSIPELGDSFDPKVPYDGLPSDHPLRDVRILFEDGTASGVDLPSQVTVTQADFIKLRQQGGILLDGELKIPEFLSDPLAWFNALSDQTAADLQPLVTEFGFEASDTVLEAFQRLEPSDYLRFFEIVAEASGSVGDAIFDHVNIAQVQLFVPNVFPEIADLLQVDDSDVDNRAPSLASQIYALFDELASNGTDIDAALDTLIASGQITLSDTIANVQSKLNTLSRRLVDDAYLRGVVGSAPLSSPFGDSSSGKLLGIDFGGALLEAADGSLIATGRFPALKPDQSLEQWSGLNFVAEIEVPNSPNEFGYPRAGASINFSLSNLDASDPQDRTYEPTLLQTFLEQSGLSRVGNLGDAPQVFSQIGDWLLSGVPQGDLDFTLGVYSPGFDPSAADDNWVIQDVKQQGGMFVSGDVTLGNSFGEIHGDVTMALLADADSPTGITFVGEFDGWGRFGFISPISGQWVGLGTDDSNGDGIHDDPSPRIRGRITPSGCVEFQLEPLIGEPLNLHFSLNAGACDARVVIRDVAAVEPAGDSSVTRVVQVPVRIENVPLTWSSGEIKVSYDIDNYAQYGVDFIVRDAQGQTIPSVNESLWRRGELIFTASDVQQGPDGLFAEKQIEIVLLGDGLAPSEGDREIIFHFDPPSAPVGQSLSLRDDTATLTIIDSDFVVPARPENAAIFYDFQEGRFNSLDRAPDPNLTDPEFLAGDNASDFRYSSHPLFYSLPGTDGVPDNSEGTVVGRGFAESTTSVQDPYGLAHGFEFEATFPELFAPNYIEFWDKSTKPLDRWSVYAILPDSHEDPLLATKIELDVRKVLAVQGDSALSAHAKLEGWSKWRVDIGNSLREPVPSLDAFDFGPRPYFSNDRRVIFRLIPRGRSEHARVIDNVALFGGAQQQVGSFTGRNIDIDDFVNGRMQFNVLGGPGTINLTFEPADPSINDPVPFDDMQATIEIIGGDATTVVAVTVTDRDPSWGPLDLSNFNIRGDLLRLDLSGAGLVKGNFHASGNVREFPIDSIADGSLIDFGGDTNATTELLADGSIGTPGGQGVLMFIRGALTGSVQGGVHGGRVDADRLAGFDVFGGLSSDVLLQHGFTGLNITGDLISSNFLTGQAGDAQAASSGSISVVGSINVGRAKFVGDIGAITATDGFIHFGNFVADRVARIEAISTAAAHPQADVTGVYDVLSVDRVASLGGDIRATLVTHDPVHTSLDLSATADHNGRGGTIYSTNSLHVAGGVESLIADEVNINLVSGGPIEQVIVGESSGGSLTGQIKAARLGDVIVHGDSNLILQATATADSLDTIPAISSLQVHGDLSGAWISTQPHSLIATIQVGLGETGGSISGNVLIDGSVGSFIATDVTQRVEIQGNLDSYRLGRLDADLIIAGQQSGEGLLGELSANGRVIVQGIPDGVEPGSRIVGQLYFDANHNSQFDPGEWTDRQFEIQLKDDQGNVVATSPTYWIDVNRNAQKDNAIEQGWFVFSQVPLGEYTVVPVLPTGFEQTSPSEKLQVTQAETQIRFDNGIRQLIPWHNLLLPEDVNDDGFVSPIDALLVINYLNSNSSRNVPYTVPENGFIDVSGDNFMSPIDALLVINYLNRKNGNEESEASVAPDEQPPVASSLKADTVDLALEALGAALFEQDEIERRLKERRSYAIL